MRFYAGAPANGSVRTRSRARWYVSPRGFETVTYMTDGGMDAQSSTREP